jgi:hypothetical protein
VKRGVYTLFALSPLFYISLFIGALISPAIRTFPDTNETPEQVFIGGFMLVSLLAYIWDIWTNAGMPKTKRALWTAVMFRGTGLPFPFVSGTTCAVLDLTMVINPRLTPRSSGLSPAAGYWRPSGAVTPRHQRVAVGRPARPLRPGIRLACDPHGHGHESLLSVSSGR